jgi:hypothetical protein
MKISLKAVNLKEVKMEIEGIIDNITPIAKESLEETLLDIVKYAKAEQYPSSFKNWTWNLRNSIGATKDEQINVKDAGAATVIIDGVKYLAKAMDGKERVKVLPNGKLVGKFIVPMYYAIFVNTYYNNFALRAISSRYRNFSKHLDKNLKKYKIKNRIL